MDIFEKLENSFFYYSKVNEEIKRQELLDDINEIITLVIFNIINSKELKEFNYYLANLESIIEKYQPMSLGIFTIRVKNKLNLLFKDLTIVSEKETLDVDENKIKEYEDLYNSLYMKCVGKRIQIKDDFFFDVNLNKQDKSEFMEFLIEIFQTKIHKVDMTEEDIQNQFTLLFFIKNLAYESGNVSLFHYIAATYLEVLNINRFYQLSRNLAEEILIVSYQNSTDISLSFLCYFYSYNSQQNIITSIIFSFIILTRIQEKAVVNSLYLKKFLLGLQKLFRTIKFDSIETKIYELLQDKLNLNSYEIAEIHHIHFLSLLLNKNTSVISQTLIFLTKNIEELLQAEPQMNAIRWLNLLYHIQNIFRESNIDDLNYFIKIFESVVNTEEIERLKSMSFYTNNSIKFFVEYLSSLIRTKFKENVVKDVNNFLPITDHLILNSFETQNYLEFILPMIIKADISYNFDEERYVSRDEIKLAIDQKEEKYVEAYKETLNNYVNYLKTNIYIEKDDDFIFLSEAYDKIYQLSYKKRGFSKIEFLESWDLEAMNLFLDSEQNLLRMDTHNLREIHERKFEDLRSELINFKINNNSNTGMLLVKDLSLSRFPHNLIMDSHGNFISNTQPVTNVLSAEWFINMISRTNTLTNVKPSLWVPIEDGDMVLNLLNSKIEGLCDKYKIQVSTTHYPESPLNHEINFLIAHGGSDIANFNALITKNGTSIDSSDSLNPTIVEFEKIIDEGKILILFVCHSGSMEKESFSQKVNSFVRYFIQRGYSSVIAPFWALNIDIVPIWLDTFLNNINLGANIANSVFKANHSVFEQYPDPSAWACLHLYGNPYLKYQPIIESKDKVKNI